MQFLDNLYSIPERWIQKHPGCQTMCGILKITGTVARTLCAVPWEKLITVALKVALVGFVKGTSFCYCKISE